VKGRRPIRQSFRSRSTGGLAEDIDGYLNFIDLERGLSAKTQESYASDLDQCAAFLTRRGVKDWRTAPGDVVAQWIHSLTGDELKVSSLARKLTALRGLARYLVREKYRDDDFTALLVSPKQTRSIPGTLTANEVERLLAALRQHRGVLGDLAADDRPIDVGKVAARDGADQRFEGYEPDCCRRGAQVVKPTQDRRILNAGSEPDVRKQW